MEQSLAQRRTAGFEQAGKLELVELLPADKLAGDDEVEQRLAQAFAHTRGFRRFAGHVATS